jgi:hypothetical protein
MAVMVIGEVYCIEWERTRTPKQRREAERSGCMLGL